MVLDVDFNPCLFNPLYWHLKPLLRDPEIRYIFIEGGSSAAKTYSICQALTIDMLEHQYSTMVFRRQQIDIADSVLNTFEEVIKSLELSPLFSVQRNVIKMLTGDGLHRMRFRGLDKEENIKGIAKYDIIYNNEWSQFLERHFSQQRKRLRGRPNQKFICDWNPVSAKLWIYEKWIDLEEWDDLPLDEDGIEYSSLNADFAFKRINKKGNAVWMKVTFRDNYWVVGHPDGESGFVDQHTLDDYEYDRKHHPNLYRVYADGERGIIRTGDEFWKQFNELKHVKPCSIDHSLPLHVTIDNNVAPYVTIGIWQVIADQKVLRQVYELPCRKPDNNAPKAAKKLAKWLTKIGYEDVLYLYGDTSTKAKSTVDEESRSFFDKFVGVLEDNGFILDIRMGRSNPRIALSAAFINDMYEGLGEWSIEISDVCKVSIDDYSTVKEAPDGTMMVIKKDDEDNPERKIVMYGHFSDTKRYFITTVLKAEFKVYKQGRKRTGSKAAQTEVE